MEMQLVTVDTDIAVLRPVGLLDLLAADGLRKRVTSLVAEGRVQLIVDLAQVVFLDPQGVAALVSARKAVQAEGGELRIRHLSEQARLVLRLMDPDGVVPVLDDYAAAA
jgi:anti-anti-sigma factor